MCGRYTLHTERQALARRFALELAELDALGEWQARYNIAPTQPVLGILEHEGRRRARALRWGLVPHWTDPGGALPQWINARAETLATRPAFRGAFARRRCLIPASGFYEWQAPRGASRTKTPHWIARSDGAPFAMAGLWEHWQPPVGPELWSCAIVTTAAGPRVRELHDRMPVILQPSDEAAWISPALDGDGPALAALLAHASDVDLVARPVSRAVNSARRDEPALIERSDEPQLGFLD